MIQKLLHRVQDLPADALNPVTCFLGINQNLQRQIGPVRSSEAGERLFAYLLAVQASNHPRSHCGLSAAWALPEPPSWRLSAQPPQPAVPAFPQSFEVRQTVLLVLEARNMRIDVH